MNSLIKKSFNYPIVWSPIMGLVRSILALSTLLTLSTTATSGLFATGSGRGKAPYCDSIQSMGIFCLQPNNLGVLKVICIIILLFTIIGFFPQIFGILHFWVAFSVNTGISIPDGGDQIISNLTLLMVPIALTDPRINHWQATKIPRIFPSLRISIGWSMMVVIKIQLMVLYFYSATGKMYQTEWAEGSAMYYILSGPFGASGILGDIAVHLVSKPIVAFSVAWGALLIEVLLSAAPLLHGRIRILTFIGGLLLHTGIGLLMGLWSFQIAMYACLILLFVRLDGEYFNPGYRLPWKWPGSFRYSVSHANSIQEPHRDASPAVSVGLAQKTG